MYIRWNRQQVPEQHLEGHCRDISKLCVELYAVEVDGPDCTHTRLLPVHHVESVSDGILRIYLDVGREAG